MKIAILGGSGTGKTTVCRDLGKKLSIPALHLDSVYWVKDWEHIDKTEFHSYMKKFFQKNKSWVIDGNYMNNEHFKYRLDLADIIIFLDYGTKKSLEGIYERAHKFKHQVRSDMAEGCVEGVDQVFLHYVAGYYKYKSKFLIATIKKYSNRKKVYVFKNREELYNWYNSL